MRYYLLKKIGPTTFNWLKAGILITMDFQEAITQQLPRVLKPQTQAAGKLTSVL